MAFLGAEELVNPGGAVDAPPGEDRGDRSPQPGLALKFERDVDRVRLGPETDCC